MLPPITKLKKIEKKTC